MTGWRELAADGECGCGCAGPLVLDEATRLSCWPDHTTLWLVEVRCATTGRRCVYVVDQVAFDAGDDILPPLPARGQR